MPKPQGLGFLSQRPTHENSIPEPKNLETPNPKPSILNPIP